MSTEIINIVFTNIVDIIIAVIGIATIRYGIPAAQVAVAWLKQKKLYETTLLLVKAAEQLAVAKLIPEGVKKKDLVLEWLAEKGIDATDEVDRTIEACVNDLHIIQDSVK